MIRRAAQRVLLTVLILGPALVARAGVGPAGPFTSDIILGTGQPRAVVYGGEAKLDARLRRLVTPAPAAVRTSPRFAPAAGRWMRGSTVHVVVTIDPDDPRAMTALAGAGFKPRRAAGASVEGWVRTGDLVRLGDVGAVRAVRPVERGRLRVTADEASRGALARATGFDGTGVTVGVISDGIDGLSSSFVPAGCDRGSGREGAAMMEIIGSIAPGATLRFSEGISSEVRFIQSVQCLTAAGANVIVDDIGFFLQPFFEDGSVAQAVRAAVQAGVSFHSAAGNEADAHYSDDFCPTPGSAYHDFKCSGAADNYAEFDVGAGQEIDCVLQWNDRFGHSANDYDLEMYDAETNPPTFVAASANPQNGTQDPYELVSVVNTAATTARAAVAIKRVAGSPRVLKLFCFGGSRAEYLTPGGSIVGHPAVTEDVAVGAIYVNDGGLNDVETFSSRGPSTLYFPAQTRPKPDIAAFDGVATSVSGFSPFFGTSAAAPDSAAVAALLLSKNDCRTPAQIQSTLRDTAVDIGTAGFDTASGAGRLDALAAIQAVSVKNCTTAAECNDSDVCTTDTCEGCTCVHRAISCDDANKCTADTCDPQLGCQHASLPDGSQCLDQNLCNGTETCQSAVCTPGTPLVCDDQSLCTTDSCAPLVGCVYTNACDDHNVCTEDTCDPQVGCGHDPVPDGTACPDADLCNGDETCAAGTCAAGPPLVCDDGDACSVDTCAALSGCSFPALEGFAGVSCVCGRGLAPTSCAGASVPSGVTRSFRKACNLVAKASQRAGKAKQARKLVRQAVKLLGKASRTTSKIARRGRLEASCGTALGGIVSDLQGRAARLGDTL